MSFHPHMTAPGSGFGHMKFMKDMKGMMNMMEQLKKHNKDGEVSVRPPVALARAAAAARLMCLSAVQRATCSGRPWRPTR